MAASVRYVSLGRFLDENEGSKNHPMYGVAELLQALGPSYRCEFARIVAHPGAPVVWALVCDSNLAAGLLAIFKAQKAAGMAGAVPPSGGRAHQCGYWVNQWDDARCRNLSGILPPGVKEWRCPEHRSPEHGYTEEGGKDAEQVADDPG